ncbi:hypothetical protein KIN20_004405 [Parelaphostrongylus tenuis]|nr:hypothetical protein KIN20_004405 [Parelaphostrongylus tenuis]
MTPDLLEVHIRCEAPSSSAKSRVVKAPKAACKPVSSETDGKPQRDISLRSKFPSLSFRPSFHVDFVTVPTSSLSLVSSTFLRIVERFL